MTTKLEIIRLFVNQFETELAALTQSAKAAHEAATHEESKAEDKHDTFATEASYLAQGQANRVAEVERMIHEFRTYLELPKQCQSVVPGSLIKIVCDGKTLYSFFALTGGGSQIVSEDKSVSVTTPRSPLGEALAGLKIKDAAEVETKAGLREYTVLDIE